MTIRISLFAVFLFTISCQHSEWREPIITECLEEAIETFKQLPHAEKIVRIQYRPDVYYYWFKDSYFDLGEEVLDENCTQICITDCECDNFGQFCTGELLDQPQTVIWSR